MKAGSVQCARQQKGTQHTGAALLRRTAEASCDMAPPLYKMISPTLSAALDIECSLHGWPRWGSALQTLEAVLIQNATLAGASEAKQ